MGRRDFGKKHWCQDCKIKFYDMQRPVPLCPRCGTDTSTHAPPRPSYTLRDLEKLPDPEPTPGEDGEPMYPYQDQGGTSHYVRRGWAINRPKRK